MYLFVSPDKFMCGMSTVDAAVVLTDAHASAAWLVLKGFHKYYCKKVQVHNDSTMVEKAGSGMVITLPME